MPCLEANPVGEAIHHFWADSDFSEDVVMFTFVDDIGQPLTCEDWGSTDEEGIPLMVDDGSDYIIKDWFGGLGSNYPFHIFIDHQMNVHEIYEGGLSEFFVNSKIYEMLELMNP